MRLAFLLIGLLFFSTAAVALESSYRRAELLLEPEQLKQPAGRQQFVILDARPREEYAQSHVPGAHWIDASEWKKEFSESADAEQWFERIGRLGITPQTSVVVYDDNSAKDAARMWWILRYWGVEDAKLLNGGWTGWKAANGPVDQQMPEAPQAVRFEATPNANRLATQQSVLEALANRSTQIVDSRSEGEYCGIDALSNNRAGAIPGATHLEWTDLLDDQTQRFKPAEELRKLFDQAGIDLDQNIATHCQSGGRASVMVFAMELMGADQVQNYYAGWSEWGNAEDTPIVQPPRPQK